MNKIKAAVIGGVLTAMSGVVLAETPPRYDHVVIVLLENKRDVQVIGSSSAPYLNSLAAQGANFAQAYAVTHPSQPNYIALFSGDTQGVTNDSCPQSFGNADNLGAALLAAGYSFAGYSEGLPNDGSTVCKSGRYARKHNPWVNFSNVPASSNLMMSRFPSDYSKLPTVSFVVPDLCNDMHDCSVATGDAWVKANLDGYAQWAKTHNSLLIVTFDEDDSSSSANRIPMVWVGAGIAPSVNYSRVDHYGVLRTLLDMYGLSPFARTVNAVPASGVWTTPSITPTAAPTATPKSSATPNPTVTAKPTSTPSTQCAAAWSSTKTYASAGQTVSYIGHNYRNKWWTMGEQPNASVVWQDAGACR
ncbi:hypothetical protein NT239_08955 [Chitinibacter sp. SCUT-21]|uniref:alkaline phosphatase family protein n=1 Tax=Chitinibacter sp. SCUT-21 TaxID=2970891 RepID=UPI0035A721EA